MLESIGDGALSGLGYLFIAGLVVLVYTVAKEGLGEKGNQDYDFNQKTKRYEVQPSFYKRVATGLLVVIALSGFIAFISMGSPNCTENELYGSANQCDGSEQSVNYSTEKRAERFAYFIAILGIPATIGFYSRYNQIKNQKWLEEQEAISNFKIEHERKATQKRYAELEKRSKQ